MATKNTALWQSDLVGPPGPQGPQGQPAPVDTWWEAVAAPAPGFWAWVRWLSGGTVLQLTGWYDVQGVQPYGTTVGVAWLPAGYNPPGTIRQFAPCQTMTSSNQRYVGFLSINWSQVGLIEVTTFFSDAKNFYFRPATFSNYPIA